MRALGTASQKCCASQTRGGTFGGTTLGTSSQPETQHWEHLSREEEFARSIETVVEGVHWEQQARDAKLLKHIGMRTAQYWGMQRQRDHWEQQAKETNFNWHGKKAL